MKHTHHASETDIDLCKICGKDIRDDVHLRNGQTAASYYREIEAELTRLKELNREMYDTLNWLVHLAHDVSKSGDRPGNDEWSDAWNQAMGLLAKTEGES